ncbi:hypothetical protein BJ741DRAFT_577572 [Chytriomyces cf. hyalinus JEL632]|nr:hypothetical protein BJ741DRAFT_577572 [Chytriomyces cf. hyalinus JEL632]
MSSTNSPPNSTHATINSTSPLHAYSTISHFLAPGAFNAVMLFLAIIIAGILLAILMVYALLPIQHSDHREPNLKSKSIPPSRDSMTTLDGTASPSSLLSIRHVPETRSNQVIVTPTFVPDDPKDACTKEENAGSRRTSENSSSTKTTHSKHEPQSQFLPDTTKSSGKTSPTSESPILIAKRKLKKTTSQNLLRNSSQTDLYATIDASFAQPAVNASPKSSLEHMEAWSKTRFGSPAANKAVAEQVELFGELEKWSSEQLGLWFGNEFGPEIRKALLLKEISGKDLRIMTRDDLRMKLGLTGRDIVKVEVGVAGLLRRGK